MGHNYVLYIFILYVSVCITMNAVLSVEVYIECI